MTRKIVAIGDLHGDYYRLARILSEQNILNPNSLEWNPDSNCFDVVLLGDYVDWRGEPLEGPPEDWPSGARRLIELIYHLHQTVKTVGKDQPRLAFYPLLGNHDAMMLDSYQTLEKLCENEPGVLQNHETMDALLNYFSEEHNLDEVYNWVTQGGDNTVASFGGLNTWLAVMGGEIGDFLRALPLAVALNKKLFSHSIPDSEEYWLPVHRQNKIPTEKFKTVREQYLWGRKVWGFDAFAGEPTHPLSEKEVDKMLQKLGVKAAVVGHTSLHRQQPYFHFGGKIINLDLHGVPGSPAYIEEYEHKAPKKRRRFKLRKKWKARKRFGRD